MKKLFILIIVIITGVMLTGCALFNKPQESQNTAGVSAAAVLTSASTPVQSMTPTQTASPTPSVAWPSPDASSDPVTYQDNKNVTIEYYDVDKDAKATATYEVSGDTSATSAIDAVNDVYIQKVIGSDSVKTNSIVFKDGNIYIDFTDSIYKLNLGSTGEGSVLDSIAIAYLNNVQGAKAVYFSVDGADYSTGHLEINKSKAYATK